MRVCPLTRTVIITISMRCLIKETFFPALVSLPCRRKLTIDREGEKTSRLIAYNFLQVVIKTSRNFLRDSIICECERWNKVGNYMSPLLYIRVYSNVTEGKKKEYLRNIYALTDAPSTNIKHRATYVF